MIDAAMLRKLGSTQVMMLRPSKGVARRLADLASTHGGSEPVSNLLILERRSQGGRPGPIISLEPEPIPYPVRIDCGTKQRAPIQPPSSILKSMPAMLPPIV